MSKESKAELVTQMFSFAQLLGGILIALMAHAIFPNLFLFVGVFGFRLFSDSYLIWMGLTQFIYLTPIAYFLFKKKYYAALQGVLLTASITLLVTVICGFAFK